MKVLITAPALDETNNVSGISSMVRGILSRAGDVAFSHFQAGRRDGERIGVSWLFQQAGLPLRFLLAIHRTQPDVVHINSAFAAPAIVRDLVLSRLARRAGRPVLVHIHGGEFLHTGFSGTVMPRLAADLVGNASAVAVLTEEERGVLSDRYRGANIFVLPNSVDPPPGLGNERGDGERTIIFLGRLHRSKGLDDIIEVCRTLVSQGFKFNFRCYGAGPDRDAFVNEMREILAERFLFGGVAGQGDKWQALGDADIFLLPSKFEGVPLAMLEAMSVGCIPVVSDRGGMASVIKDAYNGFLIEPGNLTQICGKLKILLSGDLGWSELRANARRTVAERYTLDKYMIALNAVYRHMLGPRRR